MQKYIILGLMLFSNIKIQSQNQEFTNELIRATHLLDDRIFNELKKKYHLQSKKLKIVQNQYSLCFGNEIEHENLKLKKTSHNELYLIKIQQANLYLRNRKFKLALKSLDEIEKLNSNLSSIQKGELDRILGVIHSKCGQYNTSNKHLYESIKHFKNASFSSGQISANIHILHNHIKSRKWKLLRKKKLYDLDHDQKQINKNPHFKASYNRISSICSYLNNELDSALLHAKKNIKLFTTTKDTVNLMSTYFNIAFTYVKANDMKSAIKYLILLKRNEKDFIDKNLNIRMLTSLLAIFADPEYEETCLKLFGFKDIGDYFNKLEQSINNIDDSDTKLNYLQQKSRFFESRGDLKKHIKTLKEETFLWEEINSKDTSSILLIQHDFELLKVNSEKLLLKKENLKKSFQLLSITLISIGLIIISTVIIVANKNKAKKNEKIKILENQLTKDKLEELKKITLKKSNLLESIQRKLHQVDNSTTEINKELRNMKILTEKDWLNYQKLFSKAYPFMEIKLKELDISLSQAEKRMLMLKKMKFHRLEITDILGISMDGVRKSEYRLKKKIKPHTMEKLLDKF